MIEIITYQQVNGVAFGSGEATIIAAFGEPQARRVNHEGETELHYPTHIARFEAGSGLFREFTLLPECEARVDGIEVAWEPSFLTVVEATDPQLVEALGFILSLKLGMAFSGFHDDDASQRAIHAFREGDWDIFRERMKPFHYQP
jgi:hypothetical protein